MMRTSPSNTCSTRTSGMSGSWPRTNPASRSMQTSGCRCRPVQMGEQTGQMGRERVHGAGKSADGTGGEMADNTARQQTMRERIDYAADVTVSTMTIHFSVVYPLLLLLVQ
ncbi:uncharacterized protein B0H18DRAFT_62559 [Fomitopsis serialis]|uniref:uncharacterized protein n=1 Tax=Fomitopsis serialis TaxID=139415 RepID=UPI0020074994|nr:uncharacterized protein B0H18DRAFT_62559 [Neoantrodia serialis]KAH9916691.1 hypothetical protein B0H18DRAFT_62559 [Neoantrodia serialis]